MYQYKNIKAVLAFYPILIDLQTTSEELARMGAWKVVEPSWVWFHNMGSALPLVLLCFFASVGATQQKEETEYEGFKVTTNSY